jgi:hypothetical protein
MSDERFTNPTRSDDPPDEDPWDDSADVINVSGKMARLCFQKCTPEYIRDVCHGRCCTSHSHGGALIAVHEFERPAVEHAGGIVIDGLLRTIAGRCPFQDPETFLCTVHGTDAQPLGCSVSPFKLNSKGTLVIRRRYVSMCCYSKGGGTPAYIAHRRSLEMVFGKAETERIVTLISQGADQVEGFPDVGVCTMLADNNQTIQEYLAKE